MLGRIEIYNAAEIFLDIGEFTILVVLVDNTHQTLSNAKYQASSDRLVHELSKDDPVIYL